jgi:hypothetical protein
MSIVQWLGIVSAVFVGQTAAFWASQVLGKRAARKARGATLSEMLKGLGVEVIGAGNQADDCNCDVCQARRRKQAEARAN